MKKLTASLVFAAMFLFLSGSAMAYYTIYDDATGGDCSSIGIWDAGTKTCTLTADLYIPSGHGINIGSDYVTLNGNGHVVNGVRNPFYTGVDIYYRTGVTVKNLRLVNFWHGIVLISSSGNSITGTNNTSNYIGILLGQSNDNIFSNNSLMSNDHGFRVVESSNNIFRGNNIANGYMGISTFRSNVTLRDNSISNNIYGFYYEDSSNQNIVYNNNFIDNQYQTFCAADNFCSNDIFSFAAPTGGNYWSNYNTPEEGCSDLNNDSFCDVPNGLDYLPWTMQDGWLTPETLIGGTITAVEELLTSGDIATVGTATSLTSTLNNALNAISGGNIQAGGNMLQAFINKVEAQAGKQISAEAAAQLIDAAEQIMSKL
ncbi:MAG: NosD domain-containing protein [Thermodesulfovibrionales bacterium]|nr:NosD domain-containing protein [Thermodesulfovibrionales bacterium]